MKIKLTAKVKHHGKADSVKNINIDALQDPGTRDIFQQHLEAFIVFQNDPKSDTKRKNYRKCKATVQKTTRTLKNRWWREKACEIQQLADANDTRGFFNAVKEIYGPSTHGQAPLKSKDGTTILKSDTEIGDRWKEHFEDLLNHKVAIDRNVLNMIPKEAKEDSLAQIPSLDEVRNAIKAMKNNKAAGPDGIPAEIYKFGGDVIQHQLHQLLTKIWINEDVPSDFRDANIITIYKRKGDISECGNYRGISLLATAGKLLARILNNHLREFFLRHRPASDRPVLHIIRDDLPPGIKISYRTDGKLLNLARLKSNTKTITKRLLEFQYADDNCVAALREDHLQQVLNAFHHAYTKLGLNNNIKKTQILYQPSPSTLGDNLPTIQRDGTSLKNVNNFCYLGSHLSVNTDLNDEIQHRLKSAGTAFGKLRTRVFGDRDIQRTTKSWFTEPLLSQRSSMRLRPGLITITT
ncbi:uncharacterized protein LOC143039763 [Oratosquilla oratoria]|uniref:uncharacterized protein LOC143039763 n=1 Tax=Oratosquilla oratoria TaxID=337810 RepID=UPI003F7656B8